jgi:hypothetical protein
MNKWKLFLRQFEDGKYQIVERTDAPGSGALDSQFVVTGPEKPEIPSCPFTRAQWLRWQADLEDKGYTIHSAFKV